MKVFITTLSACVLLLSMSNFTSGADEFEPAYDGRYLTFPPTTTTTTTSTTPPPCGCVTTTPPCGTPAPVRVTCPPCVNSRCTPNMCNLAVHLPFPGDCGKFCQCDNNGAVEFSCPPGLYFNEQLQVCDWPYDSKCTIDGTYNGGCESIKP